MTEDRSTAVDAPIRILHAEDDPDLGPLVAEFLHREDDRFAVETVADAEEALAAIETTDYDCVVADYDMPGPNGIELAERIRETDEAIPFILYTGKGSEEVASEAMTAGVTDYVQKEPSPDHYALLAKRIGNAVEQYRAEAATRRARHRFRTLVEETVDVILVVGRDATISYASPSASTVLGRAPAALEGTDGFAPIHPEDREAVMAEFAALIEDPDARRSVEFRYERPDGEQIWLEARGRNLLADPEIAGIVVYARDVTARTDRERHLERYRTMLDQMPDSAALYDAEGRYVLVNEFLAEGAGATPEEMVGRESSLITRVRERGPGDPYQELLDGEREELRGELPSFFRPGRKLWEYRLRRIELEDGRPGAVAFSRDISERHERERLLGRYRQLVDALEEPVATYDVEGRYELVNETLADRYGTTPAALRGRPSRLVELLREQGEGDPFAELIDGERDEIRTELPSPSLGSEAIMAYRLTRLEADGEPVGAVALSRDVTERRRRQRELEQTNERLEQFAGTVSHDLRNPLTVAEGRLDLAREEGDSEHLEAVAEAHGRMRGLIDDLLAMAREANRGPDVGPVALADVVDASWAAVANDGARLENEGDATVLADRDRLRQLLENLLGNAVAHAGADVTVTVGALEDGFYVADDGPGIPPADREAVFEPGHSTAPDGTGFGLNIVARLAEAHGWTVRVDEGEAGGARFEVTGVEFAT